MSLKNLLALQAQKKAAEASKPVVEENPAPAKPKGLGLNILGASKAVATPTKPKPEPKPESAADTSVFSLDDIAAMDELATPARRTTEHSGFEDEIEATAPDRDLPHDLTSQQLSFVEQLDGIYGVLHDPEMFAQSVRIIMLELQENPEYVKLVSDPDVHTMIRGMRNNMGLARIKKQEKSRKSGTATKKASAKTSAKGLDSALALLNSLGMDDDD